MSGKDRIPAYLRKALGWGLVARSGATPAMRAAFNAQLKYERAMAEHGEEVLKEAVRLSRSSVLSFDDALWRVVRHRRGLL